MLAKMLETGNKEIKCNAFTSLCKQSSLVNVIIKQFQIVHSIMPNFKVLASNKMR